MNQKILFLIDSIGALVSAAMLGLVLPRLGGIFGMPTPVLNVLAGIPVVFAVYSFLCFSIEPKNGRRFLTIIAVANLIYCCLTFACLIWFHHQLTVWDYLYFCGEIVIVAVLAIVELRTANTL
jgi:O-antigen/teichoic acid export membrane protein